MPMHDSRKKFHRNKVFGSLAEAACRQHFEAVGYNVESFGIEHTAPALCAIKSVPVAKGKNWAKLSDNLPKYPDFIISRTCESTKKTDATDKEIIREGYFVEVKFQTILNEEELNNQWNSYVDFHEMPFYMYVVVRNPNPYVLIRFSGSSEAWRTVEKITEKPMQSFSKSTDDHLSFKSAYDEIVKPTLDEIFLAQQNV